MQGWTPTDQVEVRRDGRGRILGWTVARDSEWDQEQVDLLLAATRTQGDIGSHGQPMSEATSALASPMVRGKGWHYEVPNPSVDWAARALEDAQKSRRKDYPDEDTSSLVWRVKKTFDGPQ